MVVTSNADISYQINSLIQIIDKEVLVTIVNKTVIRTASYNDTLNNEERSNEL